MNNNTKQFVAVIATGLALIMPISRGFGDENSAFLAKLSAEWWQWALSIPTSVNPQTDATGEDAVVGQRGSVWFLAGVFGGSTATVTRPCSVPQGTALFFPVLNAVAFNSPGVCGSPAESVSQLRSDAAKFVDAPANLSVTLDGVAVRIPPRVHSNVFAVTLPEENVFDSPGCNVPGGIYSPGVGDGFYVLLNPLSVGPHVLRFHGENHSADPLFQFTQDVTYKLNVVRVTLK
jgi:hypothetical protein